jgi:predicted RecA/RadA family phage recombinase
MTKFNSKGDTINYTPSADVAAGDVVVIGSLIAVASLGIAANTLGAVNVEGVFELPKAITGAIGAGALVYWDDTAEVVTTTEGTPALTQVGYTVAAAAETDPTVLVKLER